MTDTIPVLLPEAFKEKMKYLLEDEYEAFVQSYENRRVQGLRFNTLKADAKTSLSRMPLKFALKKIPWTLEGYYYDADTRPGKHPYHEAGVYYIQEPSAMAAAELLDPQPGDTVLDLCAAPGGKTTHIASRLKGKGLLVTNEIHPARAKILSQNVERMGIANAVVTNEAAPKLAVYFPHFFDKILVDAPCSGEGMFRKDENARTEWSPDNVILCAARQAEILDCAARMLKGGGRIVYSTCTFSPEENEGSIQRFLNTHPDFSIEKVPTYKGFSHGRPDWLLQGKEELRDTIRIWPHKIEGEGHYLAVLSKKGPSEKIKRRYPKTSKTDLKFCLDALAVCLHMPAIPPANLALFGEHVYAVPKEMVDYQGLKVIRPGLHLGTLKKNRFEPSHALALHLKKEQAVQSYKMELDQVSRYLRGETLQTEKLSSNGWVLMMADEYSLGWAKLVGTTLKNHYPKGLRRP